MRQYKKENGVMPRAVVLCLGALMALPCLSATAQVRILCIGDSSTQGGIAGRPDYTYRLPLQRMLTALGLKADFIGTRTRGLDGNSWPAGFDPDHEGYYGATTEQIKVQVLSHLALLPPADIALIDVGSNDADRWNARAAVAKPLEEIIVALRRRNPRVVVLVADQGLDGWRGKVQRFWVARTAHELSTPASPVDIVPIPDGWGPADLFANDTHANERGQERLAAQWLVSLVQRW